MTRRTLVALVCGALALAACGSSSKSASTTPTSAATAASAAPKRIISLAPTATEMLYAIGAGPQVVAVDNQSNYPPNAPKTDLSGLQPNVEAILQRNPDLVVTTEGGVAPQLRKLHVNTVVESAASTIDDTYKELTALGQATGHQAEAAKVVADMKQRIAAIVAAHKSAKPATYYYELDNTYYTATSKTFVGSLLSMLGLKNIADAADTKGSGYPQLSAEYILAQNPDYVFLADTKCCKQNQQTVAARPGWNTLQAVTKQHVVGLDDDVASRWGPRVVDLLQQVSQATSSGS